jgi:hypothetical protein
LLIIDLHAIIDCRPRRLCELIGKVLMDEIMVVRLLQMILSP